MNNLTKKIALSLSVLLLSGCKLEWSSHILFSKLFDKSITVADSALVAEVAACNSYEDSRKPSDSLLQVKGAINDVFPDAKFEECFTQQFNAYAKFTLPIAYGASEMLKPEHPKLRILSYDNNIAFVDIAPSLDGKLQSYQNNKLSVTDFKPSDVSVVITIDNDTGTDQKIDVRGAYVDGYPVINTQGIDFKKAKSFTFKLSNVTAETMFLPAEHNQPAIFMNKSESK